ncbi:MAG: Ig-like domain-containing protein [Fimbriimonadaceae bacterium]|nr:Ig-like domain-containing protein [Fimbriimonadaceae bacterium]
MANIMATTRRLGWLALLVGLLAAGPAPALTVVNSGSDTATVVGGLRWAITEINAGNQTAPILIQAGGGTTLASGLPALTKQCDVLFDVNFTISAAGYAALNGQVGSVRRNAGGTLTISNAAGAINSTGYQGSVTVNNVTVNGATGSNGIGYTLRTTDNFTGDLLNIGGDRGGYGLSVTTVNNVTISNSQILAVDGEGIAVSGARGNVQIGTGGPVYIGLTALLATGATSTVGSNGIHVAETSFGSVTVQDTTIANCGGHGLWIDPDGNNSTITIQRVKVGYPGTTAAAPVDQGFFDVGGDGIRIQGGSGDVFIGDTGDDTGGDDLGDLGITTNSCNSAGIRVGISDDPFNGGVTITDVRSGLEANGVYETGDGNNNRARVQDYGLVTNVSSPSPGRPVTVEHSQFTGNTVAGCSFNGGMYLHFMDNLVGVIADASDAPVQRYLGYGTPLGNGLRQGGADGDHPGTASGDGIQIAMTDGQIRSFVRNVVAGNARHGMLITALGSGVIGVQDAGNSFHRNWFGLTSIGGGTKLPSSEDASGASLADFTPAFRGNGTTLYGGTTPTSAVGSGIVYNGGGPLLICDVTIGDSAVYGLDINSAQNDTDANVWLLGAMIGVNDAGTGPGDQTIGNGTVGRSPTWNDRTFNDGAGIRINDDADHLIGDGSFKISGDEAEHTLPPSIESVIPATGIAARVVAQNRCVISSNINYGIQVDSGVGRGLVVGNPADASIAISNCYIGVDSTGVNSGTTGGMALGYGNGFDLVTGLMSPTYPNTFGAGVRAEPSSTGSHMIGGDDADELCIISANGLAGVWIDSGATFSIVGNIIGLDVTASVGQSTMANAQAYGVLLEQFATGGEFSEHRPLTGVNSSPVAMPPQFIGKLPFATLTNENGNAGTGNAGYYTNVISDNTLWGVAIEDDANHVIVANAIGTNGTFNAAIGNGESGPGLPMELSAIVAPQSFLRTGGIEIGALNQLARGHVVIGDVGTANVVSGNTGYGIAQYRDGVMDVINGWVGVDVTRAVDVGNSLSGILLWGSGVNTVLNGVVSGNGLDGISITGSGDNIIYGSNVGTNDAGDAAIGNDNHGIGIYNTALGNNVIGRPEIDPTVGVTRSNVISGNAGNGVTISGHGNNVLKANVIGLNAAGTAALPNGTAADALSGDGIQILGRGANVVGGSNTLIANGWGTASDGNVIGGNPQFGVRLTASSSLSSVGGDNTVQGNFIGLNLAGTGGLGNGAGGVAIDDAGGTGLTGVAPQGQNQLLGNAIGGNTGPGVYLEAAGQNTLSGNRIGTDSGGLVAVANTAAGINVDSNTTVLQVVGLANTADTSTTLDKGNLISGNGGPGVVLGSGQNHLVKGNRIGTNLAATAAVGNGGGGIVSLNNGATITVGGPLTGEPNVISGNSDWGLQILGDSTHDIDHNWIGLAGSGNAGIANSNGGVLINGAGDNNLSDNKISGNGGPGVQIADGQNELELNRIGTTADGSAALPGQTQTQGIYLVEPTGLTPNAVTYIGQATTGNVISGNTANGVLVAGAGDAYLISNVIGENLTGSATAGNGQNGVLVNATSTGVVSIGGLNANEQNTIGGNGQYGLQHLGGQVPTIVANRIGTNANGTSAIGNGAGGIYLGSTQTAAVTIGGATSSAGNLISGNSGPGLTLAATAAHPTSVSNNTIGTSFSRTQPVGNAGPGIWINNSQNNTIGGAGLGNVISANEDGALDGDGIRITGDGQNSITHNYLGGDGNGGSLVTTEGNEGDGIFISRAGSGAGNTITDNVIRDNGGGITVLTGAREFFSENYLVNNGFTPGSPGTVDKPPIDLSDDHALNGTATANNGLPAPVLQRVVAGSGGTATVSGTVSATATTVEIYHAVDPLATEADSDLTSIIHHGGADTLLATVTTGGSTTFSRAVPFATGDLVTAICRDANGNTSEFSRNMGLIDAASSTIVAAPTSVVADGTQSSTVTVTTADTIGTPLVGLTDVTLGYTPVFTGLVQATSPLPATDTAGQTTGTLRATASGSTTVTATSGGQTVSGPAGITTVVFTPAALDITRSTFVASATQVRSNGAALVTFTFTIRDTNGNPISGVQPSVLYVEATPSTGVNVVQPAAATDANGQTTATATGTVEQNVVFRGLSGGVGGAEIPSPRTVSFVAVPLSGSNSTLSVSGSPVAAETIVNPPNPTPSAAATLTLTLINEDGAPVVGVLPSEVVWGTGGGTNVVVTNQTTPSDNAGRFQATVRSDTIQQVTLSATVRGVPLTATGSVIFTAGAPASGNSTMNVAPTTAPADDVAAVGVTFNIRDGLNNPVADQPVVLSVTPSTGVTITQPANTDVSGQTSASFRSTQAGDVQVTATVGAAPGQFTLGPTTVAMTANPPDPARSSVAVAPTAIVADGVENATVTITLIDAYQRPIAGVRPAEITVATTPTAGVTITQPTADTNAQGQTTAQIRGTTPSTVTVVVTARGIVINPAAQPTLTLRGYVDQTFTIGTHLIAVPAQPINPSPAAVFAALLPNLRLATWQPATEDYLQYVAGSSQPSVVPGRGLWLQTAQALNVRVVGQATPDGPFDLNLSQGWNQLGNPYTGPVAFRLDQIQVYQSGNLIGPLSSTAGRAKVEAYCWIWDSVLGYLLVVDPATAGAANVPGTIPQNRGFWMLSHGNDITLRLTGPTRAAAASRSRAASPSEWLMSLTAAAAGSTAQANLFGVSSSRLAAELPPVGPTLPKVALSFVDPAGRAVAADVRGGPLTRATRWTAQVTAPQGSEVTLSWPGVNRGLPAGHKLWLLDPTSGKRVSMNSRSSYSFQQAAATRTMQVEVDPRGERALAVTSLAARPGAGRSRSVPIEYSLTTVAEVKVLIKGLRGSVVRTLTASGNVGANTVAWDRLDNQGRRVPAGVYQVELTATSADGEVARVVRTVTVD